MVRVMRGEPANITVQLGGCNVVARCVNSTSQAAQQAAADTGAIEVVAEALRRFPGNKQLIRQCSWALCSVILFHRENGLRAGRTGALNVTLMAYRRWIDDPGITMLGGALGCYLDYCNENRAIFRELGGPHLLIQNIKNNFHGPNSPWNYETVKQSLFGLSSGCWMNQDLCVAEGMVDLAVRLIMEHTSETKIAEETLQVVKSLITYSQDYQLALAKAGLAEALVKVLHKNPTDRGAISLACGTLGIFVGPFEMQGAIVGNPVRRGFDPALQALATEAGAVDQLLAVVSSTMKLQHFEHGSFNFDVDSAYNTDADCLHALNVMAKNNNVNQRKMLMAGLIDILGKKRPNLQRSRRSVFEACSLVRLLAAAGHPEAKSGLNDCVGS